MPRRSGPAQSGTPGTPRTPRRWDTWPESVCPMHLDLRNPQDLTEAIRALRRSDPGVAERLTTAQLEFLKELEFSAGSVRLGTVLGVLAALGARVRLELPDPPAPKPAAVAPPAAAPARVAGKPLRQADIVLTTRQRDFLEYVRRRDYVETVRGRSYEELLEHGFLRLSLEPGRCGYVLTGKAQDYFREGAPTLQDTDEYRRMEESGFTPTQLHWCLELREHGPLARLPAGTSQALLRKGFVEDAGAPGRPVYRLTSLGRERLEQADPDEE